MENCKLLLAILSALLINGCSAVHSTRPVGEKPYGIIAEDWDGTWITKDIFITVKVVDAQKGVIKAAWIEWKDSEAKLESYEVQLLQAGEWTFGNVKESKEGVKAQYVWAPLKRDHNAIVCWLPNVEKFKTLGKAGKLPCKEEDDSVLLSDMTPEHLKIITSEKEGSVYDWHDPLVFIRMARQDN